MNPFREAAKNVPGHWYQGKYADGCGNYCAAGHILKVLGVPEDTLLDELEAETTAAEPYIELLNRVAHEQFPERGNFIADVNDDDATTEADVLLIFDKAAVEWEAQV